MRAILISTFISLFILILPIKTQAQDRQKSYEKYSYLLYLPKGYETSKAMFPVVIYLHGGSQGGRDLRK